MWKVRRHIVRVEKLGSPDALRSLTDNLAEEGIDLIIDGMAAQHDPYGKRYAPKVFGDGRAILVGRTAQLRRGNSWKRVRSDGKGFKVSCNVPYAIYHQKGTGLYGPHKKRIVPIHAKALAFYAPGYVTKAAAGRVRYSAMAGYRFGQGQYGSAMRRKILQNAANKAVAQMKGSTLFLRSVKGAKRRMMVPEKGNMPEAWAEAFNDTCQVWFQKQFGK
jgi:hypothetical protein